MMKLDNKIQSLTPENAVEELDKLLAKVKNVHISWFGRRLVSIKGFEGSSEISLIAKQYFKSSAFRLENNPSLEDRWKCHQLWDKLFKLYNKSDQAAWWYTAPPDKVQQTIQNWYFENKRPEILSFLPEEFKQYWHESTAKIIVNGRWRIPAETVRRTIEQRRKSGL